MFKFLFSSLEKQSTDLSKAVLASLRKQYDERRHKDLVSLMKYLEKPNRKPIGDDAFKYSLKTVTVHFAKKILRNFNTSEDEEDLMDELPGPDPDPGDDSLEAQLRQSISSIVSSQKTETDPVAAIQKEFKLFEVTGVRSPNLERLYTSILALREKVYRRIRT